MYAVVTDGARRSTTPVRGMVFHTGLVIINIGNMQFLCSGFQAVIEPFDDNTVVICWTAIFHPGRNSAGSGDDACFDAGNKEVFHPLLESSIIIRCPTPGKIIGSVFG